MFLPMQPQPIGTAFRHCDAAAFKAIEQSKKYMAADGLCRQILPLVFDIAKQQYIAVRAKSAD
jgi:hypothetical protein